MILINALFWGRFHPLMVHLPIGFLLLAIIAEWFFKEEHHRKMINFIWLLGSVSAILAAVFGWLLASGGGYEEGNLFWHRWLGVGLAVVSTSIWVARSRDMIGEKKWTHVINIALLLGLTFVGHLGGNLTHGSSYLLDHAPTFVQAMFAEEDATTSYTSFDQPDSVVVYADLIEPIFAQKCMECHNEEVQRGGLNMASPELLMEGGDHGAVLVNSNARESELFRRLTLPYDHEKFMPLKGEPMTYDEVSLLAWWINSGAAFEDRLSQYEVPEDVKEMLYVMYEIDLTEKPYYEKVAVEAISEEDMSSLQQAGFKIQTIGPNSNLLDVRYAGKMDKATMNQLSLAAEQITWLDLHQTELTDDLMAAFPDMPHLTRLRLQQNPITDEGIQALAALEHLESLNLYDTDLSDAGLTSLSKIKSLKRIYLWQTNVTSEGVKAIEEALVGIEVDMGATLTPVNL